MTRRELGEYHKFPARRLARYRHHLGLKSKKRKVRMGLEDMPTEELCSRTGLWGWLMMVEREPAAYGLVSRRRS